MVRYGQYCPIAKALEVVGERWTLLIVRELLMGSRRFNDLRRGLPLVSPSVLSERMRKLVATGIVCREDHGGTYHLSPAGEELRPLVMQLGTWGQRWSRSTMQAGDLDPGFLMWDLHRNVRAAALPVRQAVIRFQFPDAKKGMRYWWLVIDDGEVTLCLVNPGRDVDVEISAGLRTMTRYWMGELSLSEARAAGALRVSGASALVRTVGAWLGQSPFAGVTSAAG